MTESDAPAAERHWEYRPDVFGGVENISDTLVVREQGVFLLSDAAGNITPGNRRGLGLYAGDTRHLSVYDFTLDGMKPVLLLSTADSGYSEDQVLGNHRTTTEDGRMVGRCTVELVRTRVLGTGLQESLTVTNYNPFPVTVRPAYYFDADFVDIFEVRGHARLHPGSLSRPQVDERSVTFRYFGADGVWRSTRIQFDRRPDLMTAYRADFILNLRPRESVQMRLQVSLDSRDEVAQDGDLLRHYQAEYGQWRGAFTGVHTDNESFNKIIERSTTDLRMLWTQDRQGWHYFAAGTPWFDALFGRDSIITSLQTLPFRHEIARDCLYLLARHQGQSVDTFNAEEPGKILHELRLDELSAIGELPYLHYYGSVDSTPLFLILAAEYYSWTADIDAMRDLRPSIFAAIDWIRRGGSRNRAGYLTYPTDSPNGLRNQGWKDSEDGVVHEDGALCEGPVALAEVQGYLYTVYRRLAPLLRALDEPEQAAALERQAARLRRRFNDDFWLDDTGTVSMAIDGQRRPSRARASNAGQVLWSRLISKERAARVRDMLLENDMFSGWGIRTLSEASPVYNPVGYHVGTIWPHDNAIIAHGLKLYGFRDEVNEVATALYDAARAFPSYRLPELFGGQARSPHQPPVPYPVACRPQAWTAGSMLHILRSVLGLAADAPAGKLYVVHPKLPVWLREVHLRGLRVGKGEVSISFYREKNRTRIQLRQSDGITVVPAASWPEHL